MTENLEKIMIDAIPDGMLLVNGQGNVVRANQALLRMTGYTHSDLVGQGRLTGCFRPVCGGTIRA